MSVRRAASSIMRAIRVREFGGPEVLKVETDVPIPTPQAKQVLLRLHAAGINPVDTYIRSGTHVIKPPLPYTPGLDGAGTVEAAGEQVSRFKKGDRVYCGRGLTGCYAEYTLADEATLAPLHSNLTFSQGAAIGVPYHTAFRAIVQKCCAKSGESLLIHGASGAVGLAACQIGRALGLKVLGTAGTDQGLQAVLNSGAEQAFNHRKDGYLDEIWKATNETGVNMIVEMLADVNLENDLKLAAASGRVAVIGSRGTLELTPRLTMTRELTVHGVQLQLSTEADFREAAAFLGAGQESGWLRPVVGQEYSLEQAPDAHVEVMAHAAGTKGKLVFKL